MILGYSSEEHRTCGGFTMIIFVCGFKMINTVQSNCLKSTVNFQFVFVVWCYNTSTHKRNVLSFYLFLPQK